MEGDLDDLEEGLLELEFEEQFGEPDLDPDIADEDEDQDWFPDPGAPANG